MAELPNDSATARAEALEEEILNLRARLSRLTEQGPMRIGGAWYPPQDDDRPPWAMILLAMIFGAAAALAGVASALTSWFLTKSPV